MGVAQRSHGAGSPLIVLGMVAALIVGLVVPAGGATTGTVRVIVKYVDDAGKKVPLEGVEVIVEYDYAAPPQVACTNAKGVAVFDLEAGWDLRARVVPSLNEPRCANPGLLNPDTGKKMMAVNFDGHNGVAAYDVFQVQAGSTTRLKLVVKTPGAQGKVCGGMKTTDVGTAGDDVIDGTPEADIINAKGGNDIVTGGGGNDLICGGSGNDVLRGNAGNDILYGEGGKDKLLGGNGLGDIAVGGPGRDRCKVEKRLECEQ